MKFRLLVYTACMLVTTSVSAQNSIGISVPCGGTVVGQNSSAGFGTNGWLQYTVTTSIQPNVWTTRVLVDAHVVGVPGSATHKEGVWATSTQKQVPVPSGGLWLTNGLHRYQLTILPGIVFNAGSTQSVTEVRLNDPAAECALNGADFYWDGGQCVWAPGSPIIVDMNNDGYQLTSVRKGVLFDLDGDGRPEQVSWTARGSRNAFLAFDRNGNGVIDDGTELFGSYTPVSPTGDRTITASNGFEALRFFEAVGSTTLSDDEMSGSDAMFSRLLLWTDVNHNGFSEPDELQSAADAGIRSIGLSYRRSHRVDRFGNEFRQVARLTWANGRKDNVFDVYLNVGR